MPQSLRRMTLPLMSAAIYAVAFPPWTLFIPSFVLLVPLFRFFVRTNSTPHPTRRLLIGGMVFGTVSQAITLLWLPVGLWRIRPSVSALGLAVPLVFGLAAAGFLTAAAFLLRRTRVPMVLVLPSLWVAGEWLLERLGPFSFPWLGLATSLSDFPLLLQGAELIGARGLSWLLVAANVVVLLAWVEPERARRLRIAAALGLAVGAAAGLGWMRVRTLPVEEIGKVLLVQPGVGYREKWSPGRQDSLMAATVGLSRDAAERDRLTLVVWPELAVPGRFEHRPDWDGAIARLTDETGVPVVVGAIASDLAGGRSQIYNAAFLFQPGHGRTGQREYRKRHLIPWVEWFPAGESSGPLPFGSYAAGTSSVLFQVGSARFASTICFESAFGETLRQDRRAGADVILNLSNDAWVSGTWGPHQNAAHLVLRAIENRVGIARAANIGSSMVIDPTGQITAATEVGARGSLTGVMVRSPVRTLYTRLGDWVGLGSVVATVLMFGAALRRPGSLAVAAR